jgi:hypothetical protein
MKQLLLLLLIVCPGSFELHAQSFTTQYGDSSTGWHQATGGDINVYNFIMDTMPDPIWIKWTVTANDISGGWEFNGFCDNKLCYGGDAPGLLDGTESQVSNPYVSNVYGDFHAIFNGDAAANNSAAWIQVLAEDTINNDVKTLTFIARKGPLSIEQVTATTGINIFPNPARDHVNIFCDAKLEVNDIQIISAGGKLFSTYKATGSVTKLPLDQLAPGTYFVRLKGKDSHTLSTLTLCHY